MNTKTACAAVALLALAAAPAMAASYGAKIELLPNPPACAAQIPFLPWGLAFAGMVGSGNIQNVGYSLDPWIGYSAFKGVTPYVAMKSLSVTYPAIAYYNLGVEKTSISFVTGYVGATQHFNGYQIDADGTEHHVFSVNGREFARKFGPQDLHSSNHVLISSKGNVPFNQLRMEVRGDTAEFSIDPDSCP